MRVDRRCACTVLLGALSCGSPPADGEKTSDAVESTDERDAEEGKADVQPPRDSQQSADEGFDEGGSISDHEGTPQDEAFEQLEGPVCDGVYSVESQAELEALRNCVEITSGLIVPAFDGADLEPLARLEVVHGFLFIGSNETPGFESLEGLRSLREVGNLDINNTLVTDLSGLRSLQHVRAIEGEGDVVGLLHLSNNSRLTSLSGMEQLQSIGEFDLNGNEALTTLDGLELPEQLGAIRVIWHPSLQSTGALSQVRSLGALTIRGAGSLEVLDGLENLESLDVLEVDRNGVLHTISDAPQLTTLQQISVVDNPSLTKLASFDNVTSIGDLSVMHNPTLASLSFPSLTRADRIVVANNPQLSPTSATSLAEKSGAPAVKIGRNLGEPDLLDPCPWSGDNICDEPTGLDLCAEGTDQDCICSFECG